MNDAGPLEVRRRPRSALASWTAAVAAVLGVTLWFVTSPPALATSDQVVEASAAVGTDVYVAVYVAESDRTLRIGGVKVHVAASAPVEVEPLLCLGGSPRVTSDAASFCEQLVEPDGHDLGPGDSVVLRVRGGYAATAEIDRVRLAYRDGVRWATQPAGSPARVTVLGR
jgi:hypothetical protein